MALEFDCPYCKATIRVPDNTAGKRGRCPKCATKLTIPKLGQTRRVGEAQPFFPGPPAPPDPEAFHVEEEDDVVFQEFDGDGGNIDPNVQAALPPGDIAIPALGPTTRSLPSPVKHLPDSLLSKSKSKRGTPAWVWVMAVIVVLGGGGAAGAIYWLQNATTLEGELEGQFVENPSLPPSVVPKKMIDLPLADADKIFLQLEKNPIPLASSTGLAAVQFQANDEGLVVVVAPGASTALYRVDVTGDKKLRKFLREHAENYEHVRYDDLSVAVNKLFRILKRAQKSKGKTDVDLKEFRDSVGFTAPVRGLGHFVTAVHRKQLYPCVYEDDDALYFLLPPGTKQFHIRGKSQKRGEPYFPGEFDVTVSGSTQMKRDAESKPAKDKPTKKKDDAESMSDDDEKEMSSEK